MKKILIVFTGGTFSMKIDEKTGAAVPYFHGEDLLDMIPAAKNLAQIEIMNYSNLPGPHVTPEIMFDISQNVQNLISRSDVDAIILTHGTDTLEETAYLLDLTVKTNKPIVVIGAMKTSSDENWDGPLNLIDAIHVCNNPNSEGQGVLVCLNGEINAASEVTKTHTENIQTFRSLDFGSLGFVQKGKVIFNRLPRKLETISTKKIVSNVDLIKVYAGMTDKLFRYSADSGVSGLVVEALGVGNVPPQVFEGIQYVISKNIPVVLVSRCPSGETLDIYGYPGAGKWLHKEGAIFANYLNGQKARIKLMLCLGIVENNTELKNLIEEIGILSHS